jgi:hypothetical protein
MIVSPTFAPDEGAKWHELFSPPFPGGHTVQAGD